jgi:subtilisin family serine protease
MSGVTRWMAAITLVIAVLGHATGTALSQTAELTSPDGSGNGSYVVLLHRGSVGGARALPDVAAEVTAGGGTVRAMFSSGIDGFAARLPVGLAERLRRDPRVAIVEPDAPVHLWAEQSNPPWNLDRIDQATLPLDGLYTYDTAGAGVRLFVVDTGLRADHQDFTGRVATGFTAIVDGHGTNDCHGHGTHVAGTAAGSTYGTAKAATIVPVRVLGCDGSGTTSGVVEGLDWVLANGGTTPAVVNMSLGVTDSDALDLAVERVISGGITVVAAAGNAAADACGISPARVAAALTVGATTNIDARAPFSNIGPCLDLFAPGREIISTGLGSPTATATGSGTSMAAPHVAGIAARLLEAQPAATPAQIHASIVETATSGVITDPGAGSPNRLLHAPVSTPTLTEHETPGPVTDLQLHAGDGRLTVSFTAPSSDGGTPITHYEYSTDSGTAWVSPTPATSRSPLTISGLSNGVTYQVSIRAVNATGSGAPSAVATGVPHTVPDAPRSVSVVAGNQSVTVTWQAPPTSGGAAVTRYTATATHGGQCHWITGPLSCTITGLTNGQPYNVTVAAANTAGTGPSSAPSNPATPLGPDQSCSGAVVLWGEGKRPLDDQITRLYRAAYGRAPDHAGLRYWAERRAGGLTLEQIAGAFVGAPEWQQQYGIAPAPGDLVDRLYLNVLGRVADSAGRQFWTAVLDSGVPPRAVLVHFSESAENVSRTTTTTTPAPAAGQVFRLYQAVFGRRPDPCGFGYWVGQRNAAATLADVANAFMASPEWRSRYGSNPTTAQLVDALYHNVLGRPADPAGRAHWTAQLDTGTPPSQVLLAFSESTENRLRTGTP